MKPILPALLLTLSAAHAQPVVKPELSGLRFLLGQWSSTRGQVADTRGAIRFGIDHFANNPIKRQQQCQSALHLLLAGRPFAGLMSIVL